MVVKGAVNQLFETAHPETDPEGLITKFVAFEWFRLHRKASDADIRGPVSSRLRILLWYLDDYNRQRRYAYALPLSRRQIAYLNGPAPIAGVSDAVTVAVLNFAIGQRADDQSLGFRDLMQADALQKIVYWWCVEKAPLLRLDQSLVTAAHIDILRDQRGWSGVDFPLNVFMARFRETQSALADLDTARPRDRAALYCYLLLHAFTQPALLRFLPDEWIRESLLANSGLANSGLANSGGSSFFDQALARFAVAEGRDRASKAIALKNMGLALIGRAGVPLRPVHVNHVETRDVGECFDADKAAATALEPGVALIGPLLKISGLGQAARRSLDMLTQAEVLQPTALDFDLDNPAPVDTALQNGFVPYRNRRAINIIHINAETIPLCFAFKPNGVFADSYNIGYFFWELNEIPDCQRLSLDLLDEIWVASEFNRAIYARATAKPVVNIGTALGPLPAVAPMDRETFGIPLDAIVFLSTFDAFSFVERKNPLGTIAAFSAAFPSGRENAILILKTQNRTRVSDAYQVDIWATIDARARADRRIILLDETYSYGDTIALMKACDCYVSLHRAEGFGFGLMEAMQLRKPVICTAYSGNLDFCNEATAFMVAYALVPVQKDEYINVPRGSLWADPDIESAAEHMRTISTDRAAAAAKAQAGADHVTEAFSIQAGARRYRARLADIRKQAPTAETIAL